MATGGPWKYHIVINKNGGGLQNTFSVQEMVAKIWTHDKHDYTTSLLFLGNTVVYTARLRGGIMFQEQWRAIEEVDMMTDIHTMNIEQ